MMFIIQKYFVTIYIHTKTNKKIFFIHIPRTAGRFLDQNLIKNNYSVQHHLTKKILTNKNKIKNYVWTPSQRKNIITSKGIQVCKKKDIEFAHADYLIYNKWENIKNIPHITIVRNPIDKFFSGSSKLLKFFNQSHLENLDNFNKEITYWTDNWFKPQNEFISSSTHIWKYENGFGQSFCDWVTNILGNTFFIYTKDYDKECYDNPKTDPRLKKTKLLLNNIKTFYKKDFEIFGYK